MGSKETKAICQEFLNLKIPFVKLKMWCMEMGGKKLAMG
jgi:hypothetical protein